jgi:hypothetical protein
MSQTKATTKQIAELLQTEDKVEQVKRIESLLGTVNAPSFTVTVSVSHGQIAVGLNNPLSVNITPDQMKGVLHLGVDEITRQVTAYELEQKGKPDEGPPEMTPEQVEQVNQDVEKFLEENPDKEFVSAEDHIAGLA